MHINDKKKRKDSDTGQLELVTMLLDSNELLLRKLKVILPIINLSVQPKI